MLHLQTNVVWKNDAWLVQFSLANIDAYSPDCHYYFFTGWECWQERLDWTSQRIVGGGGNDIDDIDDDHGDVDDDDNDWPD